MSLNASSPHYLLISQKGEPPESDARPDEVLVLVLGVDSVLANWAWERVRVM